jgi:hypothetical protein
MFASSVVQRYSNARTNPELALEMRASSRSARLTRGRRTRLTGYSLLTFRDEVTKPARD